jgi:hypothetical protein
LFSKQRLLPQLTNLIEINQSDLYLSGGSL